MKRTICLILAALMLGGVVGYAAALLHAAADEDERMGAWVSIIAQSEDGGRE